jgi:hypothetical protein
MSSRAKGKQEGTHRTRTTDLTLLENFYLFIYVCNNLPFLVPLPEFTYVPCVARQSRENGCIEREREPEAVTGETNYINSHRNTPTTQRYFQRIQDSKKVQGRTLRLTR